MYWTLSPYSFLAADATWAVNKQMSFVKMTFCIIDEKKIFLIDYR